MWHVLVYFLVSCIVMFLLKKDKFTDANFVKYHAKFGIYYFSTILISLVMLPYYAIHPRNPRNVNITLHVLKHVTKICGIEWELRNGHILSQDRGAVVVSNHQSSLDVLGMYNIWEIADKMTAIAKKELFYIWPFGLSAYLSGALVFVDRKNSKKAYQKLDEASEVMIKYKTKIWVFPEGTRNEDCTRLLPFKKGAFNMAVRAQVPIIPVLFSPYYFVNTSKHVFNRGHVIIKCLEPIPTVGLTTEDTQNLIDKVYNLMLQEYKDLAKEVFSLSNGTGDNHRSIAR